MTGCECSEGGWCCRHQCYKKDAWVKLCQTSDNMFNAYENGGGPRLEKAEEKQEEKKELKLPPIKKQVTNFINSSIKHLKDGLKNVPKEVKRERLETCFSCDYLKDNRCSLCGCFVHKKTGWASEQCPHDPPKWERYNGDEHEGTD